MPQARKRVVELAREGRRLHVAGLEADVLDSGLGRLGDRAFDHALGDVHPVRVPGLADEPSQANRRVAETAADVEDAVPGPGRGPRERGLTVVAKAVDNEVAVLDPDVVQGPVPGLGGLDVVLDLTDRIGHRR